MTIFILFNAGGTTVHLFGAAIGCLGARHFIFPPFLDAPATERHELKYVQ